MKIYLACDHAGFSLKEVIKPLLIQKGYIVEDCGAHTLQPADDYPEFVALLGETISKNPEDKGFIFAGSGQAEMMLANKYRGVRAAEFYGPHLSTSSVDITGRTSSDPFEIVKLTRLHNDANVLSIGSRFVTVEEVQKAIEVFLNTAFSGEERHIRRIEEIKKIEDTL